MLTSTDRLRHDIDGEFARESLAYCIPLPAHDMLALIYTWVNGQDQAGYAFAIYEQGPEMAYFQHTDGIPAGGANFDAWNIGGLRVAVGPDLTRARAGYSDDHVTIDVEFEGMHDAFDYDSNEGGCPAYQAIDQPLRAARADAGTDGVGRTGDRHRRSGAPRPFVGPPRLGRDPSLQVAGDRRR